MEFITFYMFLTLLKTIVSLNQLAFSGGGSFGAVEIGILKRINQIENDKKIYSNYDIESCMINKAVTEDKSLDDTNFKSQFATYFDRLNSNIDAKYLYVSGR